MFSPNSPQSRFPPSPQGRRRPPHPVKPQDVFPFSVSITVPEGRTRWPRFLGLHHHGLQPKPHRLGTEWPVSDLLHKRPRAKAEDARALPQVFEEETHFRHRPPLLAVHRSASDEAATGQTARAGHPAAPRLPGPRDGQRERPWLQGNGPGWLKRVSSEQQPPEVVPGGGRYRTGRDDEWRSTQHCPGCSRRLAFSSRVARGERLLECLRFPG